MEQPQVIDEFAHEMILARLRMAGSSFSAIARELGVTPSSVSLVSMGLRSSRRIQRVIASKLGVEPERIWPDWNQKEQQMKS